VIAVAGATGTIGTELVRLLAATGADLVALVRDPGRARARLGPAVPLRAVDLADPATVASALAGADTLFLVSSDPALEPGVVEAAVAAGVGRIVKSSAIGFGTNPPAGHAAAEERVRTSGARWTVLRPSAFQQTLAGYLPAITGADGVFELPAGDGRTAFVDARDIAAVAAAVLLDPPASDAVHLVTGPEALSMADVAAIVAAGTGEDIRYRAVDAERARRSLAAHGAGAMVGFLTAHYSAVAAGGFDLVADTVLRLTGRPARSLADLVAEDPPQWRRRMPGNVR
jgi:uncharacterized protein YbjT (DUF2867 family)